MSLAYNEKYSVENYHSWKGDWELIYGNPYAMTPSPLYGHQYTNGKIFRQLDEQLDNCQKCHAVIETDIEFSKETIVRPDSMVICYEPGEKLTKSPDIVFEVISKSTAKRDEILKFDLYQNESVKYYILVYPEIMKAKLYQLIDFKYQKLKDFTDENYTFKLTDCNIDFDFGFIWRNKKK